MSKGCGMDRIRNLDEQETQYYLDAVRDRDEYSFKQLHHQTSNEFVFKGEAYKLLSPEEKEWADDLLKKIDKEKDVWESDDEFIY